MGMFAGDGQSERLTALATVFLEKTQAELDRQGYLAKPGREAHHWPKLPRNRCSRPSPARTALTSSRRSKPSLTR